MGCRAKILRWGSIGCALILSALCRAETNAVSPWRFGGVDSTEPKPPVVSNVPPPQVAVDTGQTDADEFFAKYKEALKLVERNRPQDAAITMDLLAHSLTHSPWMEIAILKHAQLVEATNDRVAEDSYRLLRQRLVNAPYFQGNAERAKIMAVALQGAVDAGITRVRIHRVDQALARYFARYREYPESLAKLSIFGYIDMEDTFNANNQRIRYVPQMPQMTPFISYKGRDLEPAVPEPFINTSPRLETTSRISDYPVRYAARIRLPGQAEPAHVEENQTVQGFFVAAVASGGAIVSTPQRVLVLVAP